MGRCGSAVHHGLWLRRERHCRTTRRWTTYNSATRCRTIACMTLFHHDDIVVGEFIDERAYGGLHCGGSR
jgi:hypothetical protein